MITISSGKVKIMTRGTAYVLYEKDGQIWMGATDEFNGDMYPGSKHDDMVKALCKVFTYEDFGLVMHKFNKENHNYDDFQIYHHTLEAKLGPVNYIDFDKDYYSEWFSDYIFVLNLTGKDFLFKEKDRVVEKNILIPHDCIAVFNFGKLNGIYYRDSITRLTDALSHI